MRGRLRMWMLAVVVMVCALPARAIDAFYFTSSPSSWIGHGLTLYMTPPTTPVQARREYNLGAYTNSVNLSAGGYSFQFVEPNLSVPTVGMYDATRWPFMGNGPGMAFMSPGRGNNMLTGWFNVLQADYNTDGSVLSMAVDFRQYDEGNTTWWNQGSIRYNSSIPVVPEPSVGLVAVAVGMLWRRRFRPRR